jgi:hypothetical protein
MGVFLFHDDDGLIVLVEERPLDPVGGANVEDGPSRVAPSVRIRTRECRGQSADSAVGDPTTAAW